MIKKYGLIFPDVDFTSFANPNKYEILEEGFYNQNIFGYNEEDIRKRNYISINEFESPDRNDPPEIVKKEIVKDYLIPVLHKAELRYATKTMTEYYEHLKYSDTSIVKLKERNLSFLKECEQKVKQAKYLAGGVKKHILDSIKRLISFVDTELNTVHLENPDDHKIEIKLNKKDSLLFLLYLNEKELFGKKLNRKELAAMASIHFKHLVGSNSYKQMDYRSASQELSRVLKSTDSDELPKKFQDFKTVIFNLRKGK